MLRKPKFRILADWDIHVDAKSEYKAQVSVDTKRKRATIYGWPKGRPMPVDFYLHEYLHIASRALCAMSPHKRYKTDAEEFFVQDVCRIMRRLKGK